ncbi:MAG TPA: hypothetical protein VE779_02435 [Candidatus Angelobacter sp.]|nr:hypothetical protein [Candidatus Angelobacter sp.]
MKIISVVLLLLTASAFADVGGPTPHHSSKKTVKGSGCVEKAPENSCRVVIDSKTGQLYDLLFTANTPKAGIAIQFTGTPHHGASSCMQGKPVKVSKWKKEKGIKCPPPVIAQMGR